VPCATASAFAAGSQQEPASAAASVVPQHVVAAVGAGEAVAGVLPQQPVAAGGVNAAAGSPVNPPVFGVLIRDLLVWSEVGWQLQGLSPGSVEQCVGPAAAGARLRAGLAELGGRRAGEQPAEKLDHRRPV
jgi:hypothetical protein